MSPKAILHYMTASPYSRACELTIHALGITDKVELKEINLAQQAHLSDEYAKINPRKQVPFLVDGNLSISESKAISTYLCEKYAPNHSLYPTDNLETRAKINELLHYDGSELSVMVMQFRLALNGEEIPKTLDDKLVKVLTFLNTKLRGANFSVGDSLTLADIALCSSLPFVEIIGTKLAEYPNIEAYLKFTSAKIPQFEELTKPALQFLSQYYEAKKAEHAKQKQQ